MSVGADVQLNAVTRFFCEPQGVPVHVLRGISMHVKRGERIAIMGPSGSGKTTLLQIIGALDRPNSGEVRINDFVLEKLDASARAQFRNRDVGFIFQGHHLLPQLNVFENVMLPVWGGRANEKHLKRAQALLRRVGLAEKLGAFPGQLSGGERQRVAVARALILQPCLILADEPTGSLDQANACELMNLLVQINQEEQATLIIVTHAEAAARLMTRCLTIENGIIK